MIDASARAGNDETERAVAGEIKRGFVWLGAASAVARVLDALATIGVLWFVSREQLGLATLAWSIGVFVEAFNGFGVATALVQAPELERATLSDAFWYTMGLALALIALVWAAAPLLAELWGARALAPLIRVSALKLLLVGAALVPLQILNRAMRFERIAAANTLVSLGSGLTTLALAYAGLGAWALVLGQLGYGLTIALAAYSFQPFRPRFTFSPRRFKPFAAFGARAASAGIVYQLYRNADYFFMGRYLGVAEVGLYRVAFDLAITPTQTVLNVVNRAALPGYARLQTDRPALARAFAWTAKSLMLMLAPVTVFVAAGARDVLSLVDEGRWIEAAPVTAWLSWAALLRSLALLFPQLFHAVGRPGLALLDSLVSAALLCACFVIALSGFGATAGVMAMGWAWFTGAVLLLGVLYLLARVVLPLSLSVLARNLVPGAGGLLVLALLSALCDRLLPAQVSPASALVLRSLALAVGYWAYLRFALAVRWRDIATGERP